MPLLKLLNCLFGKSQPAESSKPTRQRSGRSSATTTRKLAKPTTPKPTASKSRDSSAVKAKPAAKRSVLDLVSGGLHGPLCRMIKKSAASSVLEVGVGDGTRAMAILTTLAKSQPNTEIRYIAIDLFEMGSGLITLKEFNQQIRFTGVKPNLIPMPCQQGLTRVAHTFGTVDLVLISDPEMDACEPLLGRVTTPSSQILQFNGQSWQQIERKNRGQTPGHRAA